MRPRLPAGGSRPPAPDALPLTVIPVAGQGCEDVLVGPDARVWTGTEDGGLHVHDPADGSVRRVATTGGRPLGLEWLADGRLLVCDALRGLLALRVGRSPEEQQVEVLATEAGGTRLTFTNNAAVAPDGTIWFTDSSDRWGVEHWKKDLIEHTCSGRLLRRAPDGETVTVVSGLGFANGVALSPQADAVFVAETAFARVRRVPLVDGRPAPADPWVEDLPGLPDNISLGSDGLVWMALAAPPDPVLSLLQRLPHPVRSLVNRAPEAVKPNPVRSARVQAYDLEGRLVHDLTFDTTDFHLVTGVREWHGRVWLGSLHQPAIAVADVPGPRAAQTR